MTRQRQGENHGRLQLCAQSRVYNLLPFVVSNIGSIRGFRIAAINKKSRGHKPYVSQPNFHRQRHYRICN